MIAKLTIAGYMVKHIMTVKQTDDVLVAIKQLLSHKTTCAPVVDNTGNIVGMLSEKDCMRVVLDSSYNQGMSGKVEDFMRKEIISVNVDTSIVDLAEKLKDSSVRSFPVLDGKKLVGLISRTEVLKALVGVK